MNTIVESPFICLMKLTVRETLVKTADGRVSTEKNSVVEILGKDPFRTRGPFLGSAPGLKRVQRIGNACERAPFRIKACGDQRTAFSGKYVEIWFGMNVAARR